MVCPKKRRIGVAMITFVVGLPASGKTHYAKSLGGRLIDDPKDFKKDIFPYLTEDCELVIADPFLCSSASRERATNWILEILPGAELKWVFFENNPEQCLRNAAKRMEEGDDRKVAGSIKSMSKSYKVPEGEKCLPVWAPIC